MSFASFLRLKRVLNGWGDEMDGLVYRRYVPSLEYLEIIMLQKMYVNDTLHGRFILKFIYCRFFLFAIVPRAHIIFFPQTVHIPDLS